MQSANYSYLLSPMKRGQVSYDEWGDHQSSGESLTADKRGWTQMNCPALIRVNLRSSAVTVWLCFNSHTEQIQLFIEGADV
jgi:hypothetical protein